MKKMFLNNVKVQQIRYFPMDDEKHTHLVCLSQKYFHQTIVIYSNHFSAIQQACLAAPMCLLLFFWSYCLAIENL